MTETTTAETTEAEQNDNFNVADEVPPSLWVDFEYDEVGEYVHIIPDRENRELRCYRSIDETGEGNRRLKTTIPNVGISYHFKSDDEKELNGFYLTWMEAKSFMTFLDIVSQGRSGKISLSWWEDSGKDSLKNERINEETLNLTMEKPNGTPRQIQIASTWQSDLNKMAKIEGEGF